MSSDLCVTDEFSFSPFTDSTIDILQYPIFEEKSSNLEHFPQDKLEYLTISPIPMSQNHFSVRSQFSDFSNSEAKTQNFLTNPVLVNKEDEFIKLDVVAPRIFENPNFQNGLNSRTQNSNISSLELKTQDMEIYQNFRPHSYGGAENVERFMQKSYSSSSFNVKPNLSFRPNNFVMENQNSQNQAIRRVCSTGDLQVIKGVESSYVNNSIEDANFKVKRYSVEEKKERIHRYRAKRNQRNFNKKIKYACRKTLADNRARVRGRFARNDETIELPETANFSSFEEDDESWVDGYSEEERTVRGGTIFNILGRAQFQYYGFS